MQSSSMNRFSLIAVSLLLAGCSTVLESAKIEIAEDMSSSTELLFYERTPTDNSYLTKIENGATRCGGETRRYGDREREYLQVRAAFRTRDALNAARDCAATLDDEAPRLEISSRDGLLTKEFVVKLRHQIPAGSLSGWFANEYYITVPGKIDSITDSSSLLFGSVETAMVTGNRLIVRINKFSEAVMEARLAELCPNPEDCVGTKAKKQLNMILDLQIQSVQKSRIDTQSAIVLLVFLLGSLVLWVTFKHLISRRKFDG